MKRLKAVKKFIPKPIMDQGLLRRSQKAGKQPGLVEYTGDYIVETTIKQLQFSEVDVEDFDDGSPKDIFGRCLPGKVDWIDVYGLSSTDKIKELGDLFQIHPLIQEDIADTEQLAKSELFNDHVFVTLKMLSVNEKQEIEREHVSLVLGEHYVISFQERPGDVFNQLRQRITEKIGKIRFRGADYLFCQLIDAVVDQYFAVFEKVRSDIEQLEMKILDNKKEDVSNEIIAIRKNIIQLRRMVMPLREALSKLKRFDTRLMNAEWNHYLDDTSDQLEHVLSSFDSFRDMLNYLMDLNFANLTNETNEIVKTLTVISAIFIPLTFIAGLYGMNFNNMPGQNDPKGFTYIVIVMAVIVTLSLIASKRRKWW
ncbi:MAG: magnesium/cobalt transporter CorA [Bacteroidetes bacterium]|nr:magnesium/cobalt transporter CorA [Bacteroidota bacterium]